MHLMMGWVRFVELNEKASKESSNKWTAISEALKALNRPASEIAGAWAFLSEEMKSKNEQRTKEFRKQMLAFPTKTQLRILACLIDDRGHPLWEIAEELKVDEGYLSHAIKELSDFGVVYRGKDRPSTRKKTRSRKPPEKRPEHPLYINKELEIIFNLHGRVEMKLDHLGTKAPITLKILSKWLEATEKECKNAGEGVRLDPKPFTDHEISSLMSGTYLIDFSKATQEIDKTT
jgi:hypothetical protein